MNCNSSLLLILMIAAITQCQTMSAANETIADNNGSYALYEFTGIIDRYLVENLTRQETIDELVVLKDQVLLFNLTANQSGQSLNATDASEDEKITFALTEFIDAMENYESENSTEESTLSELVVLRQQILVKNLTGAFDNSTSETSTDIRTEITTSVAAEDIDERELKVDDDGTIVDGISRNSEENERCSLVEDLVNIFMNHTDSAYDGDDQIETTTERRHARGYDVMQLDSAGKVVVDTGAAMMLSENFASTPRTGPGNWDAFNRFRRNPVLWSAFQFDPASLIGAAEWIRQMMFSNLPQSHIDPIEINKMVLERPLNAKYAPTTDAKTLLQQFQLDWSMRKAFAEGADLLPYVVESVASKLPEAKISLNTNAFNCPTTIRTDRPTSIAATVPLPWNLRLRQLIHSSFAERPELSSGYYTKISKCIVKCVVYPEKQLAGDVAFASQDPTASVVDESLKLAVTEEQKAFLNTVIDHPVILDAMMKDKDFVLLVLEEAVKLEMVNALMVATTLHNAVLTYFSRHPYILEQLVNNPMLVASHNTAFTMQHTGMPNAAQVSQAASYNQQAAIIIERIIDSQQQQQQQAKPFFLLRRNVHLVPTAGF